MLNAMPKIVTLLVASFSVSSNVQLGITLSFLRYTNKLGINTSEHNTVTIIILCNIIYFFLIKFWCMTGIKPAEAFTQP